MLHQPAWQLFAIFIIVCSYSFCLFLDKNQLLEIAKANAAAMCANAGTFMYRVVLTIYSSKLYIASHCYFLGMHQTRYRYWVSVSPQSITTIVLNQIHRSLNIFLFLQPPWRQPCAAQALWPHCSLWAPWPACRPLLRFIQILAWLWRKWGGSYHRRPTTWASRSLQMWERSSEKCLNYPLLNYIYPQKVGMHRYRYLVPIPGLSTPLVLVKYVPMPPRHR